MYTLFCGGIVRRISLCTIAVLSLCCACVKRNSEPNKKNAVYQPSSSVRTHVDQGLSQSALPENGTSDESSYLLPQPTDENKSGNCQPGFYRDLETDICVEDIEPKDLKY